MVLVALLRVPLVLNARAHLDSDLAVDGITLADATRGHWRWHYPGTPHMGILPVLLSWPQAKLAGASPEALVSGGVVAYELVVAAVFVLALRVFGARVAAWALVPLVFSSTGTLWLSGRLTGGHLLTAFWHAVAFVGLYANLTRGGFLRAAGLGLWCGLGLYLDTMFAFSLAGLASAALGANLGEGRLGRGLGLALVFFATLLLGLVPRLAGDRADPYDAYHEQFQTVKDIQTLEGHAEILILQCLPRLIAGHRWPAFQSDPDPSSLGVRSAARSSGGPDPVALLCVGLAIPLFLLGSLARLFGWSLPRHRAGTPSQPQAEFESAVHRAQSAVSTGLLLACAAVLAAFVLNRNIFNSDNYRYLVFLLVPWPIGFGLIMNAIARRGLGGRVVAGVLAGAFALVMTRDTARWYQGFGWLDRAGRPVRVAQRDPTLEWLARNPEISHIFGGYWDVYRLSFLSEGGVKGVPYPDFPNRFPEWSRDLPGHRPRTLVARATREGNYYRSAALRDGGRVLARSRELSIIDWP
jgi:hypothetical protein